MPGPMRTDLNIAAIDEFVHSATGPVADDLRRRSEQGVREAQRLAPVSPHGSDGRPPGYLRDQIHYELGRDEQGLFVAIESPARNANGDPYGLFNEVGTDDMAAQPYLRPALDATLRS
jgi:HK97 gp10 family phage protein